MDNLHIYAFADEASPRIDDQIKAMQRNGLQGLEIRNVDGENVSSISLDKAREVRKKLDDAGLITWSIGSERRTSACSPSSFLQRKTLLFSARRSWTVCIAW